MLCISVTRVDGGNGEDSASSEVLTASPCPLACQSIIEYNLWGMAGDNTHTHTHSDTRTFKQCFGLMFFAKVWRGHRFIKISINQRL